MNVRKTLRGGSITRSFVKKTKARKKERKKESLIYADPKWHTTNFLWSLVFLLSMIYYEEKRDVSLLHECSKFFLFLFLIEVKERKRESSRETHKEENCCHMANSTTIVHIRLDFLSLYLPIYHTRTSLFFIFTNWNFLKSIDLVTLFNSIIDFTHCFLHLRRYTLELFARSLKWFFFP